MPNPTRPAGLLQRYREELQARYYARRTVVTYEQWWRGWMGVEDLRCYYGSMTLIFSGCRSLCAMARVVRIGA